MNKATFNLNMLGAFIKDQIMSNLNYTFFVTIKRFWIRLRYSHVTKKPTKSNNLYCSRSHSLILYFNGRMSNNTLLLTLLRNK